jgi:hypothetical protein
MAITTKWTILTCSSKCSKQANLYHFVNTSGNELFLPAETLGYGIYELKLTVTSIAIPILTESSSVYITTAPSMITVHLVPFGISEITHGYEQDLVLDPGQFSVSLNEKVFNANVSFAINTFI